MGISNSRLLEVTDEHVTFRTKEGKTATVKPVEFLRRFVQHVLPGGFTKIRHYGLLAGANVKGKLEVARRLLGAGEAPPPPEAPSLVSGEAASAEPLGQTDAKKASSSAEPQVPTKGASKERPDWVSKLEELTGRNVLRCPRCGGAMVRREVPRARRREPP